MSEDNISTEEVGSVVALDERETEVVQLLAEELEISEHKVIRRAIAKLQIEVFGVEDEPPVGCPELT